MPTSVKLTGGPALEAALTELGSKIAGRLGTNAVRAGARVIAARARALAPRGPTGELKRSIRVFDDRELSLQRGSERAAYAGTRLFYASFVEFGHPHAAPKAFMRPAADEGAQSAVDKMVDNLAQGIARETQKYAGK